MYLLDFMDYTLTDNQKRKKTIYLNSSFAKQSLDLAQTKSSFRWDQFSLGPKVG